MIDSDKLQRFIFDHCDIRGEIITLADSYRQVLATTDYPPAIRQLLGQFQAAAGLLSATLKFDGVITLQARGDGPLTLIMADCTRHRNLRAVAEYDPDFDFEQAGGAACLNELIGSGQLSITIDASKGERYQGIVPLEKATLADCLEDYFRQSEQLPTRIWLTADSNCAAGLLLQALPQQLTADEEQNRQQWEHLCKLAETIKAEEQLQLGHNELLYRLFHQDQLRLLDATELQFACSCSEQRTANMIKTIGRDELDGLLEEHGRIEVSCHFCNQQYLFSAGDIDRLFGDETPVIH